MEQNTQKLADIVYRIADELISQKKDEIIDFVSDIVYEVTSSDKMQIVDHSLGDNPYDLSGELVTVDNKIDIYTYKKNEDYPGGYRSLIEDYLSNFYTGQRSATYTSGMGWKYQTYYDYIEDYLFEVTNEIAESIFDYIYKNHRELLIPHLLFGEDINNQEECYDSWVELSYDLEVNGGAMVNELECLFENIDLVKLYELGKRKSEESENATQSN
ncbi:hypothetical protein [Tuberibacillus calidus]|uniref:hypothetical protein n=1 Tax=Tuberibacillus calidus TaxID=340097 RepID=UPI000408E3BE|nr:hypothetical protein [Tuberibacillus calidus]